MAKLKGVKVLDMKVEYDGEIYEKVDGPAQKGDLMRPNGKHVESHIKHYAFYYVIDTDGYSADVIDDAGKRNGLSHKMYDAFRKISVQPSLADRVTALEDKSNDLEKRVREIEKGIEIPEVTINGVKYRKVTDREPRVGDYVKFDEAPHCYLTAGKYYEIVKFDGADPIIIDDDGDEYDTFGEEFEVYEKVTDENALKFLRIGRKPGEFKVGDIVKGPKGNSFVDIFEVIEIREGSTCPIRFINRNGENDGFSVHANLTLIAPVEARVDRP